MAQSTFFHFSSESGPSGNFRDSQISHKLCRLSHAIEEDTLENSRHQNSSFQNDHRASMWQLGASRWLSTGLQFCGNCFFTDVRSSARGWAVLVGLHLDVPRPIPEWSKAKYMLRSGAKHSPPFFLWERPLGQTSTFSNFACSWCTFAGYWK